MSFAQHCMPIGFANNAFSAILVDSKTYPDFDTLMEAKFFLERPDQIRLLHSGYLQRRDSIKKALVSKYVIDTSNYVISSLDKISDEILPRAENKVKPWYLEGHSS